MFSNLNFCSVRPAASSLITLNGSSIKLMLPVAFRLPIVMQTVVAPTNIPEPLRYITKGNQDCTIQKECEDLRKAMSHPDTSCFASHKPRCLWKWPFQIFQDSPEPLNLLILFFELSTKATDDRDIFCVLKSKEFNLTHRPKFMNTDATIQDSQCGFTGRRSFVALSLDAVGISCSWCSNFFTRTSLEPILSCPQTHFARMPADRRHGAIN